MSLIKRLKLIALVVVFATKALAASAAGTDLDIRVGVYNFPPIAGFSDNNKVEGLLADTLTHLDEAHPEVSFEVIHTSPKRRYLDFRAGLYDVIFFESPDWGWETLAHEATIPILTDEELFVALRKPDRDLSFFDDLSQRRIVAISGYHYGFADFETNNAELEKRFNIEFSDSHQRNIDLIKADRPSVADVAMVSRSYLQQHLERHPEDWNTFLLSDQPDQVYRLAIITRKGGPVDASDMIRLFQPLMSDGTYRMLVEKWGLQLPPGFLTGFPYLP
ncbi:substrate-binding periplasmic protein [Marinobacter sp.]|uniref:substrate-binding periplasmic protein n=1 Tax=Marinobacter sp. TaxID=50741 RepID=UPI0034A1BAA9